MPVCKLIHAVFVLILISCGTNVSKDNTQNQKDPISNQANSSVKINTDTLANTQEQYASINKIFQKSDTIYIEADYIQFLTGVEAIEAARKVNEVDTFINEDGKISFAVPNDYFILNESKIIRQLPVSKNCIFDLLHNPDRLHPVSENSLQSLQSIYKDSPFILTINGSGIIIKIKEVLLP